MTLMTNSGRDEKALDELLPGFDALGWGLKCRPEAEMRKSRYLTESGLMPQTQTEHAGQ